MQNSLEIYENAIPTIIKRQCKEGNIGNRCQEDQRRIHQIPLNNGRRNSAFNLEPRVSPRMPMVDGQDKYNELEKSSTRKHSERGPAKSYIGSSDVRWECLLADRTELEGSRYGETNDHHNANHAENDNESTAEPPIMVQQRDGSDQKQSCGTVVRTKPL